jgi:CMP-N-acetylneuraminic acid synthetase
MTNEVFKAQQAKKLKKLKVIVTVRESDIKIMKFDYFQNFLKNVCEIFDEKNLIVIPDSLVIADKLKLLGFNVPFIRDKFFSMDFVDIRDVLRSIITRVVPQNFLSSYILYLNANFPLRNLKRLKEAETKLIDDTADVIYHVAPLGHSTIEKSSTNEGESIILYMDEGPRLVRKNKKYNVLTGFGTFYKINYLLDIDQERPNIKIIEVDNSIETLELKNEVDWNSFRDKIEN